VTDECRTKNGWERDERRGLKRTNRTFATILRGEEQGEEELNIRDGTNGFRPQRKAWVVKGGNGGLFGRKLEMKGDQ